MDIVPRHIIHVSFLSEYLDCVSSASTYFVQSFLSLSLKQQSHLIEENDSLAAKFLSSAIAGSPGIEVTQMMRKVGTVFLALSSAKLPEMSAGL